jgi:ABC-type transporter Mla subunit MlaD
MFNARDDLQNALNELQQAIPDKGGHRVQAIDLVNQAIDQVNQGIQFGAQ